MRIIDSIKSILIEQIKSYRVLLELLQRERECLINLDAHEVENLSKEKDTTLLRLRLLEEERASGLSRNTLLIMQSPVTLV
jgi:hypothetical protein